MSHSNIFQISDKPITPDEYRTPEDFYENSDDFADYIGDEITDEEERKECIGYLADTIEDVFTHEGDGVFVYKGDEALRKFKQEWLAEIQTQTARLTADNMQNEQNLYRLSAATERTHLNCNYRIKIEEWNGYAGPISDLFEWAESKLKEGDRIYVGAVIDYHY
jgi:hypothetical protein